jgi:hypothetical protein
MFRTSNAHLNCPQLVREDINKTGVDKFLQYGESGVGSPLICNFAFTSLTSRLKRLKYVNALWNESIRLNTVSPAGQMQVAQDDVLPPIPELGVDPRPVKKYATLVSWVVECALVDTVWS